MKVRFLYDYASPYSYLADSRIDAVLSDLDVELERVPVYLRGFESFRSGVPFSAARSAFMGRDLQRCAAEQATPFSMNPFMPVNGKHALRAALALAGSPHAALTDALRRALVERAWGTPPPDADRDLSKPEVVLELAGAVGVDPQWLAPQLETAEVKQRLRANTEAAVEAGAFGVPTFLVGDELYFGNDRLEQLKRRLEGVAQDG